MGDYTHIQKHRGKRQCKIRTYIWLTMQIKSQIANNHHYARGKKKGFPLEPAQDND